MASPSFRDQDARKILTPNGPVLRVRTIDDAAFGAATPVVPKFISLSDPASRWTGANRGLAFFAYCTNYLIDLRRAVIMDVEATTAVRQAEVTAQRRMIDRTHERFGLWPERLSADAGYGSAENLAWLVHERGIEPHIPVFDKSQRTDGTFSRDDFAPMTTNATATSALAAMNSGSAKKSIECRAPSSMRTA
jgi:Transposase DDE domain